MMGVVKKTPLLSRVVAQERSYPLSMPFACLLVNNPRYILGRNLEPIIPQPDFGSALAPSLAKHCKGF